MWVQTQGTSLLNPLANLARFQSNLIRFILNCNFLFLFLTYEKVYMNKSGRFFFLFCPFRNRVLLSWFIHWALLAIEYISLSYFKKSPYLLHKICFLKMLFELSQCKALCVNLCLKIPFELILLYAYPCKSSI